MATYACTNDNNNTWCAFTHHTKARSINCCARARRNGISRSPRGFHTVSEIRKLAVHAETLENALTVLPESSKERQHLVRGKADGTLLILNSPEVKDLRSKIKDFVGERQADPILTPTPKVETPAPSGLDELLDMRIRIAVEQSLAGYKPEPSLLTSDIEEIAKRVANDMLPKTIRIQINENGFDVPEGDHIHKSMPEIIRMYETRTNFALIGPTGCGKTHAIQQFAETRGIEWGCVSMTEGVTESQLIGRREPCAEGGFHFVGTRFLELFENGGLMLLGEADAADANVLLALNNALSNKWLAVPHRTDKPIAKMHPDFVCAIDMNTFGKGGNRLFVRNRQDEAFLDRFWQIMLDYDRELEKGLVQDKQWREWCWKLRDAVDELKLPRSVSTRQMMSCDKMMRMTDLPLDDSKRQMTMGWTEDELKRVQTRGVSLPSAA